jgi:molecular chaperone DnaJ
MTVSGDYYEVLGVPRDADTETIKNAFRRLARRYHPDISTEPDAEQRFKEIAEAYGVLSDPAKRADYDAQGAAGLAGATAEDLWGGIDFADIFGPGAAAFGSLFDRLFGPPAAGRTRGQDVHLDLSASLDEVLTGGRRAVTIRRPGPCPQCAGSGSRPGTGPRRCPGCGGTGQLAAASRHGPLLVRQVITCPECAGRGRVIDQPCPACQASGRSLRAETVTIAIPPGIPDGATLRLAGRGMPSPVRGGPPGDAYVSIHTRPDPRFTRDGADLCHDLHLQVSDAALGVTTAVPLLHGQAQIRVPPGTQPGSVLRVQGKGLPRYDGHGRGSLNLTVILDIPRQLSPRQRQLYEQLRAEDARTTRTAGRSGEPTASRSGRRTAADAGRRRPGRQPVRRLIAAIRDNDERDVEETVLQLARTRKIFAPLALAAGAFVMLFSGLRLLVTNWRLMLVQILPAMWLWAVTYDLKAKILRGEQFHDIRGPIVLVLFAAVVLITIAAFYLNAAFAFAISRPGSPDLRAGFDQARQHIRAVTGWGAAVGLALGVATMLAPRWGRGWFTLLLGIVLAVMMVCYVTVPARIVGVRTARPAATVQSGRAAKLAGVAVTGLFGAIVCTPPYVIARAGIYLLGSSALFPLGVALLIIGLMLEAGATGAVKAIKVSAKLLAGRSPDPPTTRSTGP